MQGAFGAGDNEQQDVVHREATEARGKIITSRDKKDRAHPRATDSLVYSRFK